MRMARKVMGRDVAKYLCACRKYNNDRNYCMRKAYANILMFYPPAHEN